MKNEYGCELVMKKSMAFSLLSKSLHFFAFFLLSLLSFFLSGVSLVVE